MAWPKLRKRKPPVTFGNTNGGAPDGTQSDAAVADETPSDAAVTDETPSDAAIADSAAGEGAAHGSSANGVTPNGSPANGGAAASGAASPGAPLAWPGSGGAVGLDPAEAAGAAEASGMAEAPGAAEAAEDPGAAEAAEDPAEVVPFWAWTPSARPDSAAGDPPQDQPGDKPAVSQPSGRWSEPVVTPVVKADDEPQREGIGQHLGNLAHLSANPRMRTWQWRAIFAILVGIVFSIWISWRLGLTLAVLVVIADTIYRSRASYVGPGEAEMTGAQRRTRRQLARLEHAGYRAIHLRPIPDSEDQIDHLVVGPAGVFAIDSETWDRRMPVRTTSHRELWLGPASQKPRLEHARWEAGRAAELISRALGSQVSVRAALAVYGPKIPWEMATIREVDVFRGPLLRKYVRRQARQARRRGEGPLSASEIERIDKAAHVAFPDPAG